MLEIRCDSRGIRVFLIPHELSPPSHSAWRQSIVQQTAKYLTRDPHIAAGSWPATKCDAEITEHLASGVEDLDRAGNEVRSRGLREGGARGRGQAERLGLLEVESSGCIH